MTDALRWILAVSIMALVLVWAFSFGPTVVLPDHVADAFRWIGNGAGSLNAFIDADTLWVTILFCIWFEILLGVYKLTIWWVLKFIDRN